MSLFSLPPLSVPGIGNLPNPIAPSNPVPIEPSLPSITLSFPQPSPPTIQPPPPSRAPPPPPPPSQPTTTTTRETTPAVPIDPSTSDEGAHSLESSQSSEPTLVSNDQGSQTSTSTVIVAPTGQLSPGQPNMTFLDNKSAKAGVFTVIAIVGLSVFIGIGLLIYRRRKAKRFDMEHNEAMVGYAPRVPIDGDDDYPSSHSNTDNTYFHSHHGQSEEMAPFSNHLMQERQHDDVPVYLPTHLAYSNSHPAGEYDPYQQDPFMDRYAAFGDYQAGYEGESYQTHNVENKSEESHLEPPSPWPRMGNLPKVFGSGSPGSEISLEFPRRALRVTNGVDESHA